MRRRAQAQGVEAGAGRGGGVRHGRLAGASCSPSLRTPATAVLGSSLLNLSYLLQVGTLTAWSFRAWLTPGLEPCGRPLGKGAGLGCCKGCCLPGRCGTGGAIISRIWLCEDCRARKQSPLWLPRKETRVPPVCRLNRPVKITPTDWAPMNQVFLYVIAFSSVSLSCRNLNRIPATDSGHF